MNNRIVICSGGQLGEWALPYLKVGDLFIGADSGARFLVEHGIRPDIAIGDFDSVTPEQLGRIRESSGRTIECDPIDKNFTDTEMAFRLALDLKPASILLLGALGTRFDHSLANVHLLALADANGIQATIVDETNRITAISKDSMIERHDHPQVSLLPLTSAVTGITLDGFQYPLHDATLQIGQSLGISNVLLGNTGTIRVKEGRLLVIQSRD
ncbi:thiamine diphosphokinase [Paenibacillus sp. LHD-117]|uniref:thiamine diphosphokinase n=1 Tax=Paenibacillus sp. LHD-117 TaxID=3071412 RepID=UPI0027E1B01F|nr:thiamine diphosphokinase [Paenibacillus sp. LHD-117]MDQ6418076.1 thiamine diphosphokinase [Paenibacillus sp. LHD-117]